MLQLQSPTWATSSTQETQKNMYTSSRIAKAWIHKCNKLSKKVYAHYLFWEYDEYIFRSEEFSRFQSGVCWRLSVGILRLFLSQFLSFMHSLQAYAPHSRAQTSLPVKECLPRQSYARNHSVWAEWIEVTNGQFLRELRSKTPTFLV